MGKKGSSSSSSWLTVVKKVFRSPTKEADTNSGNQKDARAVIDDKKKDTRRWMPKRYYHQQDSTHQKDGRVADPCSSEHRQAIALSVAATAAAEVAVATAQAQAAVVKFSRSNYAATVIQTAFRGYLARRALRALRGLVKLQALVRGHNVRKQAKMTFRCMEALVRVQERVRMQRMRLSREWTTGPSLIGTSNSWESERVRKMAERKYSTGEGYGAINHWDHRPHTVQHMKVMSENRKGAALNRERALAYSVSRQLLRNSEKVSSRDEEELPERRRWLERWMTTKSSDMGRRASTDHRDMLRTIEMDTARPSSCSRRSHRYAGSHASGSPVHYRCHYPTASGPYPGTPVKPRPLRVHSASPRCIREDSGFSSSAGTPSIPSYYYHGNGDYWSVSTELPNYMAPTESAKARVRSHSAPRQRLSSPQGERFASVRKRLAFPVPDEVGCSQSLRSPSFKSVQAGLLWDEQMPSSLADYSPSSTGEFRRWRH